MQQIEWQIAAPKHVLYNLKDRKYWIVDNTEILFSCSFGATVRIRGRMMVNFPGWLYLITFSCWWSTCRKTRDCANISKAFGEICRYWRDKVVDCAHPFLSPEEMSCLWLGPCLLLQKLEDWGCQDGAWDTAFGFTALENTTPLDGADRKFWEIRLLTELDV